MTGFPPVSGIVRSAPTAHRSPPAHDSRTRTFRPDRRANCCCCAGDPTARWCRTRRHCLDECGPSCGPGPVRIRGGRVWLSGLLLHQQRFLGTQCCLEFQFRSPMVLPPGRNLGQPRRFAVAVGVDAHGMDARGQRVQPASAAGDGGAHSRRDGADIDRLSAVHAVYLQSLRASAARRARWAGPQSAVARPRHGDSPAHALHGLRWLFGGICVCDRRFAGRQARRHLGALVASVDHHGLGVSHDRHSAGQLVGVLRTRLGWLVVLGPGGECLVHALARRHRADAFAGGDGKARRLSRLDGAARHYRVLVILAGNLPGALRRAHLSACVCDRPGARRIYPGVPGHCHRRLAGAVCLARAARRPWRKI